MGSNKKLPFTLNRNDRRSLLAQVTDGLRMGIAQGYYAPGDIIPSTRGLASALGVSHIVTEAALRRLVAEGYVESRPRRGTVVRDRNAKQWCGHVVFVGFTDDGNFYQTMFAATLRTKLMDAGYLFTEASLSWNAHNIPDFSALDAVLSRSVDLVIARSSDLRLFRHLNKFKVPYISIDGDNATATGSVGFTFFDRSLATEHFIADCLRLGIREVVSFHNKYKHCDILPACLKVGIAARRVMVALPENLSTNRLEAVRTAGMETVAKMIADGQIVKGQKPGSNPFQRPHDERNRRCFFFTDDYIASGALFAFALAGLEAPRDIRVATWANAGIVPAYPHELSRMEMDPVAAGRQISVAVLEYLNTGKYPSGGVIGPRWVPGETMGS